MPIFQQMTNAADDVTRGRYVDASTLKPAHADDISAIDHLMNSDGETVLLKSMTDTRHGGAEAIVWGPFTVKKYTYDQVNYGLCRVNSVSWCKRGYVCVRLEPVSSDEYLSHKYNGKNMNVESGDVDSCGHVIEFGSVAHDVVSFRFISWSTKRDHVGMKADTTPMTMWDYTPSADVDTMYQWKLVEEVTAEPTEQPTAVPTTLVPTSIVTPAPGEPTAQPVNPTTLPPVEPTPAPSHTMVIPPHPQPPAHSPASASTSSLSTGVIVGIAAAAGLLIIGTLLAVMAVRRNRKKTGRSAHTVFRLEVENGEQLVGDELEADASEELLPARAATFSDGNNNNAGADLLVTPLVNTTGATTPSSEQVVILDESSDALDDL